MFDVAVCLTLCPQVCQFMDQTCGRLLNTGFMTVERYHSRCLKKVKAQLPRRESERRNHPLARHCDILSAIETRLSLLGMTFMKYVDAKLCCFIPGKVIDEIYKLLRIVQAAQNISRVHDLLQELRDISSMAMEYFEEKIAPKLKVQMNARSPALAAIAAASKLTMRGINPGQGTLCSYKSPFRSIGTNEEMVKLQQSVKQLSETYRKDMLDMKKTIRTLEQTLREQKTQLTEHQERIRRLEDGRLVQTVSGPDLKPAVAKTTNRSSRKTTVPAAQSSPVAHCTRSKRRNDELVTTDAKKKRK